MNSTNNNARHYRADPALATAIYTPDGARIVLSVPPDFDLAPFRDFLIAALNAAPDQQPEGTP